jgi:hypothetical protein
MLQNPKCMTKSLPLLNILVTDSSSVESHRLGNYVSKRSFQSFPTDDECQYLLLLSSIIDSLIPLSSLQEFNEIHSPQNRSSQDWQITQYESKGYLGMLKSYMNVSDRLTDVICICERAISNSPEDMKLNTSITISDILISLGYIYVHAPFQISITTSTEPLISSRLIPVLVSIWIELISNMNQFSPNQITKSSVHQLNKYVTIFLSFTVLIIKY